MATFISVKNYKGDKILINLDHVEEFEALSDDEGTEDTTPTKVFFRSGGSTIILITVDRLIEEISKAKDV